MTDDRSDARSDLAVRVTADTSQFKSRLREAESLARGFGGALSSAFQSAATSGGKLDGVFKTLIGRLSKLALDAAFKPLERGLASGLTALFGGIGQGAGIPIKPTPFAKGGVFSSPHLFGGGGGGLGVLGEAGPEAVMPLSRDGSGRLGVRIQGQGGGRMPNVTVNVTARDAESFRRAESDVAAAVSRAVSRGQRNL